jgi:hypothetical protein
MSFLSITMFVFILFGGCSQNASTQPITGGDQKEYYKSPELLIGELYKSVSFTNTDSLPDWEKVRAMFTENAIVVLRTSRTRTTIFDVQGFIDDFVNFIDKSPAKQKGFGERILKMKKVVVGDIAHILVLYDAQIYGVTIPPQQGVDSWQLIKKDNRWWIASITNEVISETVPVPDELK